MGETPRYFTDVPGLGRSIGKGIERLPYTNEQLLVSLSNSLALHERDCRAAASFWGRLFGWLGKQVDPDRIEIDGTRLRQLFKLAEMKPPFEISAGGTYTIKLVLFRRLLFDASLNA